MRQTKSLVIALLASSAWVSPAMSQTVPQYITPDRNGVDLTTGLPWLGFEEGGIGSGPGRVTMQRYWAGAAGWVDNWTGGLFVAPVFGVTGRYYVQLGGTADTFLHGTGSNYANLKGNGSTLTLVGSTYIYTSADGTQIEYPDEPFNLQTSFCAGADPSTCRVPTTVTTPNGVKFRLAWTSAQLCVQSSGGTCTQWMTFKRLASVTSSAGYSLTVAYATNSPGTGTQPVADWYKRTSVTFDKSVTHPLPLPTITYAYPSSTVVTITDPASRTWQLTTSGTGQLTAIQVPDSTHDDITYNYGAGGTISVATNEGVASNYLITTPSTGQPFMTVTNALGKTIKVTIASNGRPASYEDELHRITQFAYGTSNRLQSITAPELNWVEFTYDGRGNVLDTTYHPKTGSTTIASHASFDASCTSTTLKTCNQPNTTTDALGNVTQYTYDPAHGGVTAILPPKASTNAVQPETDIAYTSVVSASGDAVYMPTKVSACQNGAPGSCTNASDETRTTYHYNSNLLPDTTTSQDGTGALAETNTMAYDARGNMTSNDGPLSGTADTWAFKYDPADRMIGTISPDPDGSGSLKNRAVRTTYMHEQVSKTEIGTTLGQSDSDFAAMVTSQYGQTYFDGNWRPNMYRVVGGTSGQTQTQYSYDALGRLSCAAIRMDRNQFTPDVNLDACTLGANVGDPDRITKYAYSDASELVQTRVGFGVMGTSGSGVADQTASYTPNGNLDYLIDGEGQRSEIKYDAYDRQQCLIYPSATRPSPANPPIYNDATQSTALATAGALGGDCTTGDFEFYTYDNASHILSQRLRSGNVIGFAYDHTGRLTLKDLPGAEYDVSYRYDLLNRLTSAFQKDSGGVTIQNLTFTWDALSRNIDRSGPRGTIHSDYDLADRRTKLTYPGTGLYVNYDYLLTGEMTKVRQNGATSGKAVLAIYAYDDLGNRASLTLGNGEVTTYTYDSVSRLNSQNIHFPTGTNDLLIRNMVYNPASQLTSVNRTNDLYSWTGFGSGTTSYTPNGLNQYSSINAATPTYDTNGNMLTEPQSGKTYAYSNENLLISASGGGAPAATLTYDPLMHLYEDKQTASGAASRFVYDGTDMIAEYDQSNALQKRYVFGADMDEPLVQLDAAGNRTWLTADERGSIIALSDDNAAVTQINKYDEYGKPQPTNLGRFQYTGQAWLGDLGTAPASGQGLYYYKSRMYAPHLGRFMQPDPIGYVGGLNLYAYVSNDPVDFVDSLGMATWCNGAWADVCGKRPKRTPSYCGSNPSSSLCTGGAPSPSVPSLGGVGRGAFGGGSGVRSQNTPSPETIKQNQCKSAAVLKGVGNSLLDLAGLVPGEKAAAVIIRVTSMSILTTNSVLRGDAAGGALAGAGFFNDLRRAVPTPTSGEFARAVGASVPAVGWFIAGASVTKDIVDAHDAYQKCGQ